MLTDKIILYRRVFGYRFSFMFKLSMIYAISHAWSIQFGGVVTGHIVIFSQFSLDQSERLAAWIRRSFLYSAGVYMAVGLALLV